MFGASGSGNVFSAGLNSSNVTTGTTGITSGTNIGIVPSFSSANPPNTFVLQPEPSTNQRNAPLNLESGTSLLSQLLNSRTSVFGPDSALTVNSLVADDKSTITFEQLSHIINVFGTELEEREQFFVETGIKSQKRDVSLAENSEKITDLQNTLEEEKVKQTQISSTIDQVLCQQTEIEHLIDSFEKQVNENPPEESILRKNNFYNGCIETDITLLKMKECLNVINEKVNEQMQRYLGDEKTNSVADIVKILNTVAWTLDYLYNTISQLKTETDASMVLCTAYKSRLSALRPLSSRVE